MARLPSHDQIGAISRRTLEQDCAAREAVTRRAIDDTDRARLLQMLDLEEK